MDMTLKRKYRVQGVVRGFPAKPRTGNSHGPAKGRKKNGKLNHVQWVMLVDGLTGKRKMVRDA